MGNNYGTLRIELPQITYGDTRQEFSVIDSCDASHVKSLIIQQDNYDGNVPRSNDDSRLVVIPETISRLAAIETITINAYVEELPVALSKLSNLKLLDLSGCYNLLSIPEQILEMKDLKIKIGPITSRASDILFITVPSTGIRPEVFSKISSANTKKLEQLTITQILPTSRNGR